MRSRSSPCRPVINASAISKRHHADHDAEGRDQGDEGDERLLALRQQVADGDEELVREVVHVLT